jgi:hypothetical protein
VFTEVNNKSIYNYISMVSKKIISVKFLLWKIADAALKKIPECDQVLDHLLSKIVVNAVDLLLLKQRSEMI